TLKLTNTIVTDNSVNLEEDYASFDSSSSNNLIGVDVGFIARPIIGSGVLTNPDELNLSLKSTSRAIDHGTNKGIGTETDLAGNPRISAAWKDPATVDIGAYEYQEHGMREERSLVVTTAEDILDSTDNLISLREAIYYADPGDTITFDTSLTEETIRLNGSQLEIVESLKIDAASVGSMTIDAAGQSRVFYIDGRYNTSGAVAELANLTITGGKASESGGGICNQAATLALTNCVVKLNTASDGGGGIWTNGATTLTNTAVWGNTGGVAAAGNTTTMLNCTVAGNPGVGIGYYHSTLKLTNTIVTDNSVNLEEDYASFDSSSSNNLIGVDVGFIARPIIGAGGIVNPKKVNLSLKSTSRAIDHGTNKGIGTETDLAGNPRISAAWKDPATVDIGAYEYQEHVAREERSLVVTTEKDILDSTDGLISLREAIYYADPGDTITFAAPLADQTFSVKGTQLEIVESLKIDAASIGGAAIDAGGKNRVFYIYGDYNTSGVSAEFVNLTITGGNVVGSGGGILNLSGTLALESCMVKLNTASDGGGGIWSNGATTLTNTAVWGNSGGVAAVGNATTMLNCTVAGNPGVGIGYYGSTLKLTNTIVTDNSVNLEESFGSFDSSSSNNLIGVDVGFIARPIMGSGVLTNPDELNLSLKSTSRAIDHGTNKGIGTETDLAGNPRISAAWKDPVTVDIGAYEYQEHGAHETRSLVVTTAEDILDSADDLISLREAIHYANVGDTITFDASLAGQTIKLNGSQLEITESLTIDASSIGGVAIDADGKNRAFYIYGDYNTSGLSAEFVELTITGGNAAGSGGGICNLYGTLALETCMVKLNTASDGGGGIWTNGATTLTNTAVWGNTGGVAAAGNTTMLNCTVAGNTGVGIGYYGSALKLTNTIVTDNSVNLEESFGSFDSSSSNNLIDEEAGFVIAPIFGSGAIVNPNDVDLSLKPTSAAIDNGLNYVAWTETDLGGNQRIIGGVVDIGAYEFDPDRYFECSIESYSDVYDGEYHTVAVEGVEDGDLVLYSATGTNYSTEKVYFADAGDYTVYVKVEREGCQNWAGTGTVSISPVELTVSGTAVADKYYDYTTEAEVILGTVYGIVEGDDVTVIATAEFPSEDIGEYSLTVYYELSGAKASNYITPEEETVTASILEPVSEPLETPTIITGTGGVNVSFGANRHRLQWTEISDAWWYEVRYSIDGNDWTVFSTEETGAVIDNLPYGSEVAYSVRAMSDGSYADSEWSGPKTFSVCPMDINGDGDISGADRAILAGAWLSEEGDEGYRYDADINGDGEVANSDRLFISQNWNKEAGDDDLVYPRAAADAAFGEYEPGDFGFDQDVF
ncbi:MAG: hypothetical protein IK105_05365, partial [Thermoguttaceae bacterium]|nr:hypothetical protein [Thermoguttaceae bacterium]